MRRITALIAVAVHNPKSLRRTASNPAAIEAALRPDTRLIWVETPSNPMLKLVDLASVAQAAKGQGIITVCDNTFMTPYFQRPLDLGIDIAVHSTTKYLNGHSDCVGGFIGTSRPELAERIQFLQNAVGGVPSPMDSFLVLRGVKTLPVRMERHARNAGQVAEFLAGHSQVEKVTYPGLSSHPQHALGGFPGDPDSGRVLRRAAPEKVLALDRQSPQRIHGLGRQANIQRRPGFHDSQKQPAVIQVHALAFQLDGIRDAQSAVEHHQTPGAG